MKKSEKNKQKERGSWRREVSRVRRVPGQLRRNVRLYIVRMSVGGGSLFSEVTTRIMIEWHVYPGVSSDGDDGRCRV